MFLLLTIPPRLLRLVCQHCGGIYWGLPSRWSLGVPLSLLVLSYSVGRVFVTYCRLNLTYFPNSTTTLEQLACLERQHLPHLVRLSLLLSLPVVAVGLSSHVCPRADSRLAQPRGVYHIERFLATPRRDSTYSAGQNPHERATAVHAEVDLALSRLQYGGSGSRK